MKKLSSFLFLIFTASVASAQISAGVKASIGMGRIHSANLEENLRYQMLNESKIRTWSIDERFGVNFGFGGFVGYDFSESFTVLVEPTINFFNCGIDFNHIKNEVNDKGDGDIKTESTVSDIYMSYLNMPFLARYIFGSSKFYVQGGIGINFVGTPQITSTANSTKEEFKSGLLEKITIDPTYTYQTELNIFDRTRFDFILGAGKIFDINGKDLNVDIRYNFPLTQSEMYTTDGHYNDGHFKKNDLLAWGGKADAERDAPFLLNDFKMSSITLSIGYALFKN